MAIQNPYADMMKSWSEYKAPAMPAFDMSQMLSYGRRNAEAYSAAGQAMAESAQAIARRQAELARAQIEKLLKTTKDMLVNGSPEINTGKQVELAKTIFESQLNNLREVSELATKSGFEVFDVLNRRASASIEEITRTAAPSMASKKKTA
jgi:phasin family protein